MRGGVMDLFNPIPIKASAKLIYQLGEQLISDELVALLELIKNSYDADATSVKVTVNNNIETEYGKGLITITDNGNGMIPSIIINGFLRLSTNYKKINKLSPYFKRKTLGEKGLGRLSFQRLGKYIEVKTLPRLDRLPLMDELDEQYVKKEGYNSFVIRLDWDNFNEDSDFEKITADVIPLKEKDVKYGTSINIYGIRNANFWILNQEKRTRLNSEILSMTNPFVSQKSSDKFNLSLDVNGEKFIVDSIDEKIIDELSDVSVNFSMEDGILHIATRNKRKYFNRIKDEYIEKQKTLGFEVIEDNCDFIDYETKRHTINFNNEDNIRKNIPWIKEDIFNKINGKYAVEFKFSGNFYAVDKTAANRTEISKNLLSQSIYIQKNFTKIGGLWELIAGVYVYRDRFRVLPYGQNDWLGFTKKSQKSKATIYKEGNVSGYIQIDGSKSELLREQTDRQGILKDEYGYNFLNILSRVITEQIFKWDTDSLRANFARPIEDKKTKYLYNSDHSIRFKKLIRVDEEYHKQEAVFNKVVENVKSNETQFSFLDNNKQIAVEEAIKFKNISVEYNKELSQKISIMKGKLDEYKEIIPLLGQTILMETVTHELYRIYSKLAGSLSSLERLLLSLNDYDKKQFVHVIKELNREINDLDMQLNHIAPTHRNKLKDETDLDFRKFIVDNYVNEGVISTRLRERGITCRVNEETFTYKISLGNIIVIFDNLILNSEYWLEKFQIVNPVINFVIKSNATVTIWDNGKGIDPIIENLIFEPFKSQKESGRGLGLYIVQELLALTGASIELLADRNDYGNRYKFQIDFREEYI
jgi:signal transduction histidine kinase